MPKTDFSSVQVAGLAGVTYQTLDRWLTDGVVTCDVPAEGTGSRRRFTYRDIVFVILARTLKSQDLPISAVRSLLRVLRSNWQDDDPDHAGCLLVKSWGDASGGLWLPDLSRVDGFLDSVRTMEVTPGTWTGVIVLIDVGFLAKQALAQIAAAGEVKR